MAAKQIRARNFSHSNFSGRRTGESEVWKQTVKHAEICVKSQVGSFQLLRRGSSWTWKTSWESRIYAFDVFAKPSEKSMIKLILVLESRSNHWSNFVFHSEWVISPLDAFISPVKSSKTNWNRNNDLDVLHLMKLCLVISCNWANRSKTVLLIAFNATNSVKWAVNLTIDKPL